LKLEEALASFSVSIGHYCDLAERRAYSKLKPAPHQGLANGQAERILWSACADLTPAGFKESAVEICY
jgi:hypothetical protein